MDPRYMVADKVAIPYDDAGQTDHQELIYYVDSAGRRKNIAEYGTTATVVLLVPTQQHHDGGIPSTDKRGIAYVAHAGDSDVYLFHKDAITGGWTFLRMTGDHTVSNAYEEARLAEFGMAKKPPYWVLTIGRERGQALMPSRSVGHCLLSKHGITFEPTVTSIPVRTGDWVVVASDGLWASYGRAAARKCCWRDAPTTMCGEDLSAWMVCRFMGRLEKEGALDVDTLARGLVGEVKEYVKVVDNVMVEVVRVL